VVTTSNHIPTVDGNARMARAQLSSNRQWPLVIEIRKYFTTVTDAVAGERCSFAIGLTGTFNCGDAKTAKLGGPMQGRRTNGLETEDENANWRVVNALALRVTELIIKPTDPEGQIRK
jgi:hypothetical protein